MFEANVRLTTVEDVKNFCTEANKMKGEVLLKRGNYTIDGKSLMGIFSLDTTKPIFIEYQDEEFTPAVEKFKV